MATTIHLADQLPWNALVSNLQYNHKNKNSCNNGRANLNFRLQPNQSESLNHFVDSLLRVINEQADEERRKFPEKYEIPSPDDVVINDDVAKRISPLIHSWRTHCWSREMHDLRDHRLGYVNEIVDTELCSHNQHDKGCECTLPLTERKMSAFLREYEENDCFRFMEVNSEAFFNLEVMKTLLIQGETDTILKTCAHADIDYSDWWTQAECHCQASPLTIGWDQVYEMALRSYLTLNTLLHFPELWNWDSAPSTELNDYRRLIAYQEMILETTKTDTSTEVAKYPHMHFFGITRHQLNDLADMKESRRWNDFVQSDFVYKHRHPTGFLPYEEFLACEIPTTQGCSPCSSNPTKWAHASLPKVLQAPSRLPVPHHPFHPHNLDMLQVYLDYCWKLIIRCVLLGRETGFGMVVDRRTIVTLVDRLGSCDCCKNRQSYAEIEVEGEWVHKFV